MTSLVLTGAAGPAAETIVAELAGSGRFDEVRVLAPAPIELPEAAAGDDRVVVSVIDLVDADTDGLFDGADAVVHLGAAVDATDPYLLEPGRLVAEADAVRAATERAGVPVLVVVSSALVYGALAANPVPLTEDAPIHPGFSCRPAVEMAEIERSLVSWRAERPEVTVAVLRCAPIVADGHPGWLADELHRGLTVQAEGLNPESQYLHATDVASAILTIVERRVVGVRNVAPDGWLTGVQRQALESRPRVRVPDGIARRASTLRVRMSGSPAANGMVDYVRFPWVVANDRLRGDGWEPRTANDEAYVGAFKAAPWAMVSPSRRQELALGAAGAALVGVAGVLVWAVGRRR